MSLLLDALKKAALDKRQHDLQQSAYHTDGEACSVDDEKVLADPQEDQEDDDYPEQNLSENSSEESLTFEIEFPDQDVHTSVVELAAEAEPVTYKVAVPTAIEQPLESLADDESSCSIESNEKTEQQDLIENEVPNSEAEPAVELAIDHSDGGYQQSSSDDQKLKKAALAQLLKSSQLTASRNRRRKLVLLSGLSLTCIAIVAMYYYYLLLPADDFPTPTMSGSTEFEDSQNTESDLSAELTTFDNAALDNISTEETIEPIDQSGVVPEDSKALVKGQSVVTQIADATATKSVTKNPDRSNTLVGTDTAPIKTEPEIKPNRIQEVKQEATPDLKSNSTVASSAPSNKTSTTNATSFIQYDQPTVSPLSRAIEEGYLAYQSGNLDSAQKAYDKALALSPYHRDALLGAAAVAFRQGRQQQALQYYQQRLARAPNDNYARAGVLAMASSGLTGADKASPELDSEVNKLLNEYPQAAHLHFLKGSLHASRQQWGSAQLSFFEAWRWDKTKPDYVYNLAVSLDHLNQPKEALRLYRQALAMTETISGGFKRQQLQQRIAQLEGLEK